MNNRALKFWEKKPEATEQVSHGDAQGVAHAALAGASQRDLMTHALAEIRAENAADRIGIWMAPADEDDVPALSTNSHAAMERPDSTGSTVWHGLVWDHESPNPPLAWEQLSADAPLPAEVVSGARAVELSLAENHTEMLIGVYIGLQTALWVPIASRGRLRGVILCGARNRGGHLSRATALRVAAQLALQVAWQEERSAARARYADLNLSRRLHLEMQTANGADRVLRQLTEAIVESQPSETQPSQTLPSQGLQASFAAIGVAAEHVRHPDLAAAPEARTARAPHMEFLWKSGDPDGLAATEFAPLAEIWQTALRTGRPAGAAPPSSWHDKSVARIVAVPILAEGQVCAVLVAGLGRHGISLASLERLEFRAMLAGLALALRKREQAAALAAARQRAQLASSQDFLFVLDEALLVLNLSGAAQEFLARENTLPGAVADAVAAPFARFFANGQHQAVENWVRQDLPPVQQSWKAAEDVLDVRLKSGCEVRLRRGLPNALGHHVIVLEPVASRADAPQQNEAARALQGVIEWLEEGVVLFDARDKVLARNTRFEQFSGFATDESAEGLTQEQLIAKMRPLAADPESFAERWRQLAHGPAGGVRDELRMTQPIPRILERAARPILDANGRLLGRVEIYRDLTAQRLFQAQLLQTEKLAALGQLVTGVAHELSNPLTSILGYAQRLLLREDSRGSLPEVRQIFQEAERAGGILRQLLFNARETPPERNRISLNQVVMRSMELQRFSMVAENVRMELDLDPALPMVLGDAARLQQVLMNLVGNARQAIQQQGHGGWIRVKTSQTAERLVQLEVQDDGPGVPQSIMARIFDPFFTTKAEGVGTGLGLSIVLSIVREHGGRVNVQRGAEGGAIFSVELPIATAVVAVPAVPSRARRVHYDLRNGATAPEAGRPIAARISSAATARRAPEKTRVLVVEDEPTVARLIGDVLRDEGFAVDVLLDGREALERAATQVFDLVICDMKMPGLDGQQFFLQLVESGNPLQHSFLFVTGDVIAPATQKFLERNQLAHLAKPFRVEELTARAKEVLESGAHEQLVAKGHSASSGSQKNAARD